MLSPMASERDKMLAGEYYFPDDPDLVEQRQRCRALLRDFNVGGRSEAIRELLGGLGEGSEVVVPFHCDYGYSTTIGAHVYVNFNVVILDCATVTIGDHVQIAPGVQILTADHPRDPGERRAGLEMAAPVVIGENAWLGAGAIVLPGVSVGRDSIVGAGSVVNRDVPPGVVAAGNPCRVVREL
jgi:maltose O-acetyltransferase